MGQPTDLCSLYTARYTPFSNPKSRVKRHLAGEFHRYYRFILGLDFFVA